MAFLYLDTSYDITIGLLSDEYAWKKFARFSGQKTSGILQREIWNTLQEFSVSPVGLVGVITVAGPGFYTGLRLSEGLADVFKFFHVPHYSFYSYEVPRMTGVESGVWFTKAYRGEYFLHRWTKDNSENLLIGAKELFEISEAFVHSETSLDEKSIPFIRRTVSTSELLEKTPSVMKGIVEGREHRDSFYFRAPEDEFRVSK